MVRSCGGCGDVREGSGTFSGTTSCKTKACPFCCWRRAKEVGDFFDLAFRAVDHPGYRWQMVTVTIPYEPAEAATVEDLRRRAHRAGKVGAFLWKAELKQDGAGMYRHVEVSKRGHVHLHALYFGPPLDHVVLERLVQTSAHADTVGSIHVQAVDYVHRPREGTKGLREVSDDPRGSQEGLKRAARYISKGLDLGGGTHEESWMADQSLAATVDPRLAARWDIATYGMKLSQRYGCLVGLDLDAEPQADEESPQEPEEDDDVVCTGCGCVGDWHTVAVRTDEYILSCHAKGQKALAAAKWRPPPDD